MKKALFLAAAVLAPSLHAQANCISERSHAIRQLEDNKASASQLGVLLGFSGVLASGAAGPRAMGGVAVFSVGGGIAISIVGNWANSTEDLETARALVSNAYDGDGLALRMLQSELSERGVKVSIDDLAERITRLEREDRLCPMTEKGVVALGYSAIRELLLK